MITDARARDLAAAWHGGQFTPLYALASSGAINPTHTHYSTYAEIDECLYRLEKRPEEFDHPAQDTADLRELLDYVAHHGTRGPVSGWGAQ